MLEYQCLGKWGKYPEMRTGGALDDSKAPPLRVVQCIISVGSLDVRNKRFFILFKVILN